MTNPRECAKCKTMLPEDAPEGACPRCLLSEGLASGGDEFRDIPDVEEIAGLFPALEVLEPLGRGGMGVVYKARQKNLDRIVALKVVAPKADDKAAFAERFGREARTLAKLDHPHIVKVYDFGEAEGLYYLVMEYVDGLNLRGMMRSGGLDPKQALAVVPQVCDALQYAHDQGVVHRDIKPENILLDRRGRVKIADFGLAKLLDPGIGDPTITGTGQVMGTFHYMAPEQYRTPNDVDHRADIFSLGVVFYEMLTGELPVGRFARPSERVQVDVRLDEVVLRSLEQERDRRYQHASEVKTRIDSIAGTPGMAAPPVPRAAPPAESRLCKMAVVGAFALPAAIALFLVFLAIASGGRHASSAIAIPTMGVGLAGILGLTFSIIAWARISSSAGRLTGLGFAITGTILPLALLVFIVPVFFLLLTAGEPSEGPPDVTWAEPPVFAPPAMPPRESVPAEPRPAPVVEREVPSDVTVVGAPSLTDGARQQIAREILERMERLLAHLEGDPFDEERLRALYGGEKGTVMSEIMGREKLVALKESNKAGLPLYDFGSLPVSITKYRVRTIILDPRGRFAVVTAHANSDHRLEFGMEKDGAWWFSMGSVSLK